MSPTLLSVNLLWRVGCLWMPFVCMLFRFSLHRMSFVSVVFDFNASLNDAVPVSPIMFPVDFGEWKEWTIDWCHLCVIVRSHSIHWVQWVLCLISVHHSMMLLLCLQCRLLLIWWEWKGVFRLWISFMFFLSSLHFRYSPVSVVFDFNASLSDVAPLPPTLFSVYWWEWKKVDYWWMSFGLFLLRVPSKTSFESVVFDFNASLNDVVPVSPILLPFDLMGKKRRVNCWWISFACCLVCDHHPE